MASSVSSAGRIILGFLFIFLSPSCNWKDLFGWDLDGNGRLLLLG